jgi:hypothetical protein
MARLEINTRGADPAQHRNSDRRVAATLCAVNQAMAGVCNANDMAEGTRSLV